jgi:3',5'-cyclic-AMP phosphodiesterase
MEGINLNKLTFLHLTDTHISKNYQGSFLEKLQGPKGNPTDHLIKVLENIDSLQQDLDFILITGDLVHEGNSEDYRYFKKIIQDHVKDIPVFTVLGNHDLSKAYWEGYEGKQDCSDRLFYEKNINGYRLIVLDSSYDNSGVGIVDAQQLDWLKEVLKTPSKNGTIVSVHHPLDVGEVTDGHALSNSKEVLSIIEDSDVKAVVSGHIHQNRIKTFGSILLTAGDSTAFGLTVKSETAEFNDKTGFTFCTMDENGLSVQIVRFPNELNTLFSVPLQALQHN